MNPKEIEDLDRYLTTPPEYFGLVEEYQGEIDYKNTNEKGE
ncbi:hypothetical protein [Melissococcus plutonius]|nr:hypothetical protein [Melissococcus plutonius]